jgi:hypothetical protein
MQVFECRMLLDGVAVQLLHSEYSRAENDSCDDTIITWEAEPVAEEYDIDFESDRKMAISQGNYYCNGIGWVKLLYRYE